LKVLLSYAPVKNVHGYFCFLTANSYAAGDVDQSKIRETVDNAIRPVMQTFNIPGMAIAVTINGKKYFYNY
jgi:beta-lactamase class C